LQEAFRRIDFDYVHELATYAKKGGVKHFHYVSSAGADKNSSFLYVRVKVSAVVYLLLLEI